MQNTGVQYMRHAVGSDPRAYANRPSNQGVSYYLNGPGHAELNLSNNHGPAPYSNGSTYDYPVYQHSPEPVAQWQHPPQNEYSPQYAYADGEPDDLAIGQVPAQPLQYTLVKVPARSEVNDVMRRTLVKGLNAAISFAVMNAWVLTAELSLKALVGDVSGGIMSGFVMTMAATMFYLVVAHFTNSELVYPPMDEEFEERGSLHEAHKVSRSVQKRNPVRLR